MPFAIKIDLDNDSYTFSYNGKDVFTDRWKHDAGAKPAIEALNLFGGAGSASPSNGLVYYDNLSLKPAAKPCPGDFDCDGDRDFDDIDPFVEALNTQTCKCPDPANCDPNGDGKITFDDIDPFVALLGVPCP